VSSVDDTWTNTNMAQGRKDNDRENSQHSSSANSSITNPIRTVHDPHLSICTGNTANTAELDAQTLPIPDQLKLWELFLRKLP
jgi:hypothetical protein